MIHEEEKKDRKAPHPTKPFFKMRTLVFVVIALLAWYAFLMMSRDWSIDVSSMLVSFLVGLAFFLYGMGQMENSLDRLAGAKMKSLLQKATDKKLTGVATGAITTILVGSSSITAVLLLNLVGTSALSLARSLPVILGSNIGSTLTIQLLAFNVDAVVPYLLIAGFLVLFLSQDRRWNSIGNIIFGLALIFFGLMLMKTAMVPLREFAPFQNMMVHMSNPFLGMLVGLLFAGLIQSSAATMAVVVALAANGLITLPAGIALALGAHSGKCVTLILAFMGKIGRTVTARREFAALIIFNVSVSVFFIFFIPQLVWATERLGGDVARQVANADTLFNLLATLIFFPFTGYFTNLLEKYIQPKKPKPGEILEARYLRSEEEMQGPMGVYFGLAGLKQEIHRMGTMVLEMYKEVLPAMLSGSVDELETVNDKDKDVDILYDRIFENILIMRRVDKTPEQAEILTKLEKFSDELERAGDTVKRLAHYGMKRCEQDIEISEGTQRKIAQMHGLISGQLARMLEILSDVMTQEEREKNEQSILQERKAIYLQQEESLAYLERPRGEEDIPFRLEAFKIERDMLRYMERFYKKVRHMAELHLSRYSLNSEHEEDHNAEEENERIEEVKKKIENRR